MKSAAAACVLLWMLLTLELAWSASLPQGSLLLPSACAVMFWFRDSRGLIIASAAILIDWIARPSSLPLNGIALPLLASLIFAKLADCRFVERRTRFRIRIPGPLQLPLMTCLAVLLQAVSEIPLSAFWSLQRLSQHLDVLPRLLVPTLVIAVPVSALLSLSLRAADEFGLRRPLRRMVF